MKPLIDVARLERRVAALEHSLTLALRAIETGEIRNDAQLSRIMTLEAQVSALEADRAVDRILET